MAVFIPEDKVVEVKNAADIVEIISDIVHLKKAGKDYLGLCPFHAEKTPSFTVSPAKQIYYCFGCGEGGNVFHFLMRHEGLSFPESVGLMAGRYGIEIPTRKMSPEQKKRMTQRESLLTINKEALGFFRRALTASAAGKRALAYLKGRGMSESTLDAFSLGYAPAGWDNLIQFFAKHKMPLKSVEKSGLIVPKKKEGFYDRFRDRIIFPIQNLSGHVIGFGGRVMDDSVPKYLNSPETLLYHKSRSLYGLYQAKKPCRQAGSVFIVEGYFDLLALHQHGICNSVATLGTALTSEHLRLLKAHAANAYLVYDSDAAGIKAALRSIEIFTAEKMDARIVVLPTGHDPDSFLFEFGADAFRRAADKAPAIPAFLIESAVQQHGLSIEGKVRIISQLTDPLAAITDGLKRSLYIKMLAERLGLEESAVLEKLRQTFAAKRSQGSRTARMPDSRPAGGDPMAAGPDLYIADTPPEPESRMERQIVAMMLQFPEVLPEIRKHCVLDRFESRALKSIGLLALEHAGATGGCVAGVLNAVADKSQQQLVASLSMGDMQWDLDGCLKLISQFEYSRRRREKSLLRQIKAAEENNDQELLLELLKQKQTRVKL